METLKEGSQYELLSTSAVGSGNMSVVHVKLTDTALKAIEDFYDWAHKSRVSVRKLVPQLVQNYATQYYPELLVSSYPLVPE